MCSCDSRRHQRRSSIEACAHVATRLDRVVALRFPSGHALKKIVPRDAARSWMANLACLDASHPVRADDLDHPDELRVDLDPVPGVEWSQCARSQVSCTTHLRISVSPAGPRRLDRAACTSMRIEHDGRSHVRRAAWHSREVERRARVGDKQWKEERNGVFLVQPEREGSHGGRCVFRASET
jgi:hypothetical protein